MLTTLSMEVLRKFLVIKFNFFTKILLATAAAASEAADGDTDAYEVLG